MVDDTDAERKAVEWLDSMTKCSRPDSDAERAVTTLKRMLARPVLPEEPDEGHILAMMAAYPRSHTPREVAYDGYRALRAHLTAPKTKEVEVWRVEWSFKDTSGRWRAAGRNEETEAEAHSYERVLLGRSDAACIRVTGPHKQTVPA